MNRNVDFLGITLGALTASEMVDRILAYAVAGKHKKMTYINADCVNISFRNAEYRKILNQMDLVYAGGIGVVLGSRLFGKLLRERVNILDFFDKLAERLRENRVTMYLLGAKEDVVQKAKAELVRRYSLDIVGSHSGFFDEKEGNSIIEEINALRPNILIVGMGVPKQEKWIYEYRDRLDVNLCWAVGGAFNNFSGLLKRAPRWMIRCGLEWLYRLYQEPGRLWKRYLIGNFTFLYHAIRWKIAHHGTDS